MVIHSIKVVPECEVIKYSLPHFFPTLKNLEKNSLTVQVPERTGIEMGMTPIMGPYWGYIGV